jgi:hypothetical protein
MRVTPLTMVVLLGRKARSCRSGLLDRGSRDGGRPTAAGFRKPFHIRAFSPNAAGGQSTSAASTG